MSDEIRTTADPAYEEARERIRAQRARPPGDSDADEAKGQGPSSLSRFFRRGPWENLATVLIAAGVIMLMQPFALSLFTYSFVTILTGTVMFIIVSHFPE